MKTRNQILLLAAMAGLALVAASAHAGQIYFDDFSGSSGTDLHGTTPDVTTTAKSWVARSVYKADGSFSWESFATISLAFTPVDGRVYTLDAKIETLTGAHWVQFGFGNGQPRVSTDPNWSPRAWHLLRVAEDGSNAHNTALKDFAGLTAWSDLSLLRYAEPLDARIVLDTTGGTGSWQATWYAKADGDLAYTEVRAATLLTAEDIDSVGFSLYNTNKSGKLLSFSLSDDSAGVASTFPLTITPNASTPGNYDFEWESQEGKLYALVSDTVLGTTAPADWPVWDRRADIPSGGTTTSLIDVPGGGDPARFFVVVEKDPPPLLEEDFEAVTNPGPPTDWSYADHTQGTAWSVGTPDGTGTEPDAAANGTQCAGTNMNGDYTKSAVASIITKAFTVPASGATLSFSQYIDTEVAPSGDFGSIRLLNADDTVLTGGDIATGLEGIREVWSSVSDLPLPAVANGLSVKIEFRFESDADDDVFAGFYIDDVVVTGN